MELLAPRAKQGSEIVSDRFFGTMIRRSGQPNPAKLVKGQVTLCANSGARLHGSTPVDSIERSQD
jgi:hypothetical protein